MFEFHPAFGWVIYISGSCGKYSYNDCKIDTIMEVTDAQNSKQQVFAIKNTNPYCFLVGRMITKEKL